MPLYVYRCNKCSHEFEEIVAYDRRDNEISCPKCGALSTRLAATTFGIASKANPRDTLVSPKEIDKMVGADADRRWEQLEGRRGKRRKRWVPKPLNVPRNADGSFRPMEVLGDVNTRALRKEYSEALSEHRAERKRKGLGQFDGPGAIEG